MIEVSKFRFSLKSIFWKTTLINDMQSTIIGRINQWFLRNGWTSKNIKLYF